MTGLGTALASTGYKEREEDVAAIANKYASQNNALMRRAAASGTQTANRRGLLNSSIAAGAAQGAVLDQVVPMASQTAGQNFQRNASNQDFRQNSALSYQGFGQDRVLRRDQYGYDRGLQDQRFGHERTLAKDAFGYDSLLSKQAYGQQSNLQREAFGYDSRLSQQNYTQQRGLNEQGFTFERTLAQLDIASRERLAQQGFDVERELATMQLGWNQTLADMNLAAEAKQAAGGAIEGIYAQMESSWQAILQTPEMSAADRTKAINAIQNTMKLKIAGIEALYGVDFPTEIFSAPSGATAPATTTTTRSLPASGWFSPTGSGWL